MTTWDNLGFKSEETEFNDSVPSNDQIPRNDLSNIVSQRPAHIQGNVSANDENKRVGTSSTKSSETEEPGHDTLDNLQLDIEKPPKVLNPEEEDYSLWSYVKYLGPCRKLERFYNLLANKENLKKIVITTILITLYLAFFISALILPSQVEQDEYWCNGDGFLIIISVFFTFLLLYFQVFKPFTWPKLKRIIEKPLQAEKCLNFRDKQWQKFGIPMAELRNKWYVKPLIFVMCLVPIIVFLVIDTAGDRTRLTSAFGIGIFILFGFIFSAAPRKIVWRQVMWGMGLQFLLGVIILRWTVGKAVFVCLGEKIQAFLLFTDQGSSFVFGASLIKDVFAFKVLSVILFFSLCINVLYYYGIMQWIVSKVGWLLQVTIGTTPCESVNAAANIFLGMSEAPLLIKPYLPMMTKSELHAVLTGGFATIAGSVLAAYISFGVDPAHLLSASVMSAPAALAFSKIFYPEVETSRTNIKDIPIVKGTETNVLHAALEGVVVAIPLVANIAANLIAFIAFIAFFDAVLSWSCQLIDVEEGVCTLSNIFGYVFMPVAWSMGVPWQDCYHVGQLIGTKTIVNEFVAYVKLSDFMTNSTITKRSEIIATYALCGFSNISSIGIQLGVLGSMAPTRKGDLAQLGFRAMVAGNIACFLTACIAGTLISTPADLPQLNATITI